MSIFHRRPYLMASLVAGTALMLLPFTYLAGWLGDLGQVKPALTALTAANQEVAWHSAHKPHEPPQGTPVVSSAWSDTSVTLTWNKVAHASTYTIYRAPGSQSFSQAAPIATITPTRSLGYTDTTVLPGTTYRYWVAADNAAGEGPASPAVTVHTYLSWTTVTQLGEQAAATVSADQWSKTAWGLFGSQSKVERGPLWNISGTLVTPLVAAHSHSSWLKSKGVTWHLQGQTVTAIPINGEATKISARTSIPSLANGGWTSSDLALWDENGHWTTAVISQGAKPLPPNALILNQDGQAVGISDSSGTLVHV